MNQSPQIAARPSGLPCQIDLLAAAYPSPSRAASFVFARLVSSSWPAFCCLQVPSRVASFVFARLSRPLGLPSAAFKFRPALPRLYLLVCLVLLACLLLPSGSVPRCLVCICSSCLVLLACLLLPSGSVPRCLVCICSSVSSSWRSCYYPPYSVPCCLSRPSVNLARSALFCLISFILSRSPGYANHCFSFMSFLFCPVLTLRLPRSVCPKAAASKSLER